jgi:hypothetical protein
LLLTLLLWFLTDATVTYSLGIRGFSSFLITDRTVGDTNKPNFSGRFGGFLDSFSALASIGPLGENRPSAPLRDGDRWYFASKSPEEDDEAGRLDKAEEVPRSEFPAEEDAMLPLYTKKRSTSQRRI